MGHVNQVRKNYLDDRKEKRLRDEMERQRLAAKAIEEDGRPNNLNSNKIEKIVVSTPEKLESSVTDVSTTDEDGESS